MTSLFAQEKQPSALRENMAIYDTLSYFQRSSKNTT